MTCLKVEVSDNAQSGAHAHALAWRRSDVLYAMLRDGTLYETGRRSVAA